MAEKTYEAKAAAAYAGYCAAYAVNSVLREIINNWNYYKRSIPPTKLVRDVVVVFRITDLLLLILGPEGFRQAVTRRISHTNPAIQISSSPLDQILPALFVPASAVEAAREEAVKRAHMYASSLVRNAAEKCCEIINSVSSRTVKVGALGILSGNAPLECRGKIVKINLKKSILKHNNQPTHALQIIIGVET